MSYIWNRAKDGLINLDIVRNFEMVREGYRISMIAWISDSESINVGDFESESEATIFLDSIVNERVVFRSKGGKKDAT